MLARRVTSGEASWAPPPATMSTRLDLPRTLAAARTLSSSIFGGRAGEDGTMADTRPRCPQTSIAHSIVAGPGRPRRMDWIAFAILGDASSGPSIWDA